MHKFSKKYYFVIIPLLIITYLLFAKQIYVNQLKKTEFPQIISAIEVNLDSISKPYIKVEKAIKDSDFIKSWLENPKKDSEELVSYLKDLAKTYDLVHASVIDDHSLTYYGSDKVLELDINNTKRDGWYFDYRETSSAQGGNSVFFIDQIYPTILTIFINIPILDNLGNYIGVAGGGFYYKNFESYLNQLERLYNIELYLLKDDYILYSNNNIDIAKEFKNLNQYKKITNGVFLDDSDDNSITYIKYLSKWDNFLIVKRSNKQIIKEIALELLYALIFISIIIVIILIITSHKLIKNKSKEKESKTVREALYLNYKLTTLVNKKVNYYKMVNCQKKEISELLLFEERYISLCYKILENKNINKIEYFNITTLIRSRQ